MYLISYIPDPQLFEVQRYMIVDFSPYSTHRRWQESVLSAASTCDTRCHCCHIAAALSHPRPGSKVMFTRCKYIMFIFNHIVEDVPEMITILINSVSITDNLN